MDFSILLAILGLGVAVFSLLSPNAKLNISFKINRLDKFVFLISVFAIHYIAFTPVLKELGLLIPLGQWRLGFDAKSATYLIFLFLTIFILWRLKSTKLTKANIDRFSELSEELLFEQKYADLTSLLEKHTSQLFCLIEQGDNSARNLSNRLFTSTELVNYVAISRPQLGIELMKNSFPIKEQFVTLFMYSLIDNKGSLFYYEMENIQNLVTMHRFDIPESKKLSHFLFSDVSVSEKLAIYKPVGDKIKSLISEDKQLINRNNSSLGSFDENERQSNPIECGLHFFEIMILESMHQKIPWHMWLYYFPSFTKCIIEKLEPSPDVDLSKEWPTPFHYFLYRIIDINFNWIAEFQYVQGCETIKFNAISLQHDNGSILKSAILSVGQIIWQIIESPKFEKRFKRYCLEIALRQLRDLKDIEVFKSSYRVLIFSILFNGFMNKKELRVLELYQDLCHEIDHLLILENEDFTELLGATIKNGIV